MREGCVDLQDMMWLIDFVPQSLVWDHIEMFTGGNSIARTVQNINCVENGILLEMNVRQAFGNLRWGVVTRMENDRWRYFIKAFSEDVHFFRPGVGDGTELHFSSASGYAAPSPALCALHLAVCAVAHACGAAEVPDIIGTIAGSCALPTFPGEDDFVIPYFERRLFGEKSRLCRAITPAYK